MAKLVVCLLAIIAVPALGAADEGPPPAAAPPDAPAPPTPPAPLARPSEWPDLPGPWEKANSLILGLSASGDYGAIATYERRLVRPLSVAITTGWIEPASSYGVSAQSCCGVEGVLRLYFWGAFEEGMYLAAGATGLNLHTYQGADFRSNLRVAAGLKLSSDLGFTLNAELGSTAGGVEARVGLGFTFGRPWNF
jgi:hypothetical protein